ncbi:hypothetical protein [Lentzea californiensis]|uniref:hypothetical protein n=1 Tax=Lentzea californiensis TaxID=438851 RepID=UPI002165EDB0|nr:hypothetical protein [Lentzea californiensis]
MRFLGTSLSEQTEKSVGRDVGEERGHGQAVNLQVLASAVEVPRVHERGVELRASGVVLEPAQRTRDARVAQQPAQRPRCDDREADEPQQQDLAEALGGSTSTASATATSRVICLAASSRPRWWGSSAGSAYSANRARS